jgi:hypothetical protein
MTPDSDSGLKGKWHTVRERYRRAEEQGHPLAALKTYRYLRIGMLVVVAALGYSLLQEHRASSCWLGSISGYYYTPVGPVFVGMMVAIALALIVIKGRMVEDVLLTLAGFMAPIVAFLPTSDPTAGSTYPLFKGACLNKTWMIHHYRPDAGDGFIASSTKNNLHALAFAGAVGVMVVVSSYLFAEWWRRRSNQKEEVQRESELTRGTAINLALSVVFAAAGVFVVKFHYSWLLDKHAMAAGAMFGLLALAALVDGFLGVGDGQKKSQICGAAYLLTGATMLVAGGIFWFTKHAPNGHSVIWIEAIEITLFAIFWLIQTIERWNFTVSPAPPAAPPAAPAGGDGS